MRLARHPLLLARSSARRSIRPTHLRTYEHVELGTNTDPYQWVEGRYRLMEGIWEAMRDARNPCSILTKSPLLLRDLPLMKQIAERTEFSAALSVPTIDEQAWRATEPHTPNPRARVEAVAELSRVGVRTGVLVAPLMPGVNDSPEQVTRIIELATEAGASYITGIALHLRDEVKSLFTQWLRDHRPDLLPRYRQLYGNGAYAIFQKNGNGSRSWSSAPMSSLRREFEAECSTSSSGRTPRRMPPPGSLRSPRTMRCAYFEVIFPGTEVKLRPWSGDR
jgi:DNA repair photolyase